MTDEGVRAVADELPALTELDVAGCSLVTDDGLRAVAARPSLVRLSLGGCWRVTDAGLRAVSSQLTLLTELDLHGCSKATDEALRAVAELTALTVLDFGGCWKLTDIGVRHLSGLRSLRELDLSYCATSAAAEEELRLQIPGLSIEHDRPSDESTDGGYWGFSDEDQFWGSDEGF